MCDKNDNINSEN